MHISTLTCLFLSLLAPGKFCAIQLSTPVARCQDLPFPPIAVNAAAVAKMIEADLLTHSSSIGTRSITPEEFLKQDGEKALKWCQDEQDGVPLWLPNGEVDYFETKDWQSTSTVKAEDVRQSLIIGGPSGKKESSPLLQARLAAMAGWAQVREARTNNRSVGDY